MKKITLLAFVSLLILSACKKELDVTPATDPAEVGAMSEMKVSPDFNWKTDQQFILQVLPNANAVLMVRSADGVMFYKEYVVSGTTISRPVTLPSYQKEVTLELAGQVKTLNVEQPSLLVTFD